jgi:hypothetical protein
VPERSGTAMLGEISGFIPAVSAFDCVSARASRSADSIAMAIENVTTPRSASQDIVRASNTRSTVLPSRKISKRTSDLEEPCTRTRSMPPTSSRASQREIPPTRTRVSSRGRCRAIRVPRRSTASQVLDARFRRGAASGRRSTLTGSAAAAYLRASGAPSRRDRRSLQQTPSPRSSR